MRLREATAADSQRIAELHAHNWRTYHYSLYSAGYLEHHLLEERRRTWQERFATAAPNQFVVLAEAEAELLGFACAFGAEDPVWGSLLDNLHVRPEDQSKGIGAALLGEVSAWCRANHPGLGLYLWVLEQNARAQAFYRRLGAQERDGQTSSTPGGTPLRALRYTWATPPELPRELTHRD